MKSQKTKISIAVALLLGSTSMVTSKVWAQSEADAQDQSQQASKNSKRVSKEDIEIIEVTGIKSGLTKSLALKKLSNMVIDVVSADDIGSLPALDIGEALQVIPGITVNRENDDSSRRQSQITLRGLPGQFTQVTANDQLFATPSGAVIPTQGSPNSFGAFESGVFDGVTVYKSQRADLIEGSIAGTVDKGLASALNKRPDGEFIIRLEGRHEELADTFTPGVLLIGSKHFIENKLAGTFRFSHTEEDFRRDIINITRYVATGNRLLNEDEYRTQHGLTSDDGLIYPSDVRQYTTLTKGGRTSFVGGLEYAYSDDLEFGMDVLYTKRDLPNSSLGINQLVARAGSSRIEATSAPFLAFTDSETGQNTYAIPSYDYTEAILVPGNRSFDIQQEAKGIFFDVEYNADNWSFDGSLAMSDASYGRYAANIQSQVQPRGGNPSDVSGSVASGMGNINDYLLTVNAPIIDLDQEFVIAGIPTTQNFVRGADGATRFFYAGGEVVRDRKDKGLNANFAYDLDNEYVSSIQVGGRLSQNEIQAFILQYTVAGADFDSISNDFYTTPAHVGSTNFFNGNAPGFLNDGWNSIDINLVEQALFGNGVDNPDGLRTSAYNGVIYRTTDGVNPRGIDTIIDAKQDVFAAYAMANIDTTLNGLPLWGNIGVRFVDTQIESTGFSLINGEYEQETAETDYQHVLPSMNFAVKLQDDLVLRMAYSESIVRPNLAGFTPSKRVIEDAGSLMDRVEITLPTLELDAYESDNYDLSLEWYNREGSAITIAAYRKNVQAFFDQNVSCPADGGGLGYGPLSLIGEQGEEPICFIENSVAEGPIGKQEIRITETVNLDDTITIDGIEIGIQQNLSFLDGFWSHFGGVLNASFIDVSGSDADGNPLSFPRVSDKVYNAIVYWEDTKFSARLAYNWRSSYTLAGVGTFTGFADRDVKARSQLDLALGYKFNNHWSAKFSAYNLTDEIYEEYQSGNEALPRLTAYDGRTYSASVMYKF